MARGEFYTPEEDAIIAAQSAAKLGIAELIAAGYPERTAVAYRARRKALREKEGILATSSEALSATQTRLETQFKEACRARREIAEQLTNISFGLIAAAQHVHVDELTEGEREAIARRAEQTLRRLEDES